jgi:hypothetical protein
MKTHMPRHFTVFLLAAFPALSRAEPPKMSRGDIIVLAESGMGYSYWWGHGRWREDGDQQGSCSGSCPNCTHTGSYGADCSGFVAKVWQVPEASDVTVDLHPYSTWNFYNESTHWTRISRSELEEGDALVRRNSKGGHVMIFAGKNERGYQVYECNSCKKGCIFQTRTTLGSEYVAIRRKDIQNKEICDDQEDNDGDSKIDCDDPDCNCTQCPGEEIHCGDVVHGTNAGGVNKIDVHTGCSEWDESGPEKFYVLRDAGPCHVYARLEVDDEDVDLDIFALENACTPEACKESGDTQAYFGVDPAKVYYIVIDGYAGDAGNFTLTVECND